MRIVTLAALLVLFIVPAWASEPGQPHDCSDVTILKPGVTCSVHGSYPCGVEGVVGSCLAADNAVVDNEGYFYFMRSVPNGVVCGSGVFEREELVRTRDGLSFETLAHVDERCDADERGDEISSRHAMFFLEEEGSLLVYLRTTCKPGLTTPCEYGQWGWILRLDGFATTFDILQTYTPASGPISFRVPYMPEGFQHADWFDTYWGDLATVGDWSQAHPLQCGYPATAPSAGDYLTVEDTLPTPPPGQGYYFVTAVNYQGQRRYGRQSNGGVLSGRDPAVLPGCEQVVESP